MDIKTYKKKVHKAHLILGVGIVMLLLAVVFKW